MRPSRGAPRCSDERDRSGAAVDSRRVTERAPRELSQETIRETSQGSAVRVNAPHPAQLDDGAHDLLEGHRRVGLRSVVAARPNRRTHFDDAVRDQCLAALDHDQVAASKLARMQVHDNLVPWTQGGQHARAFNLRQALPSILGVVRIAVVSHELVRRPRTGPGCRAPWPIADSCGRRAGSPGAGLRRREPGRRGCRELR